MTRGHVLLSLVIFSAIAGVAGGAWAFFFRPVSVQVLETQHDVPVEIFGLGTVEARIVSKVGFKVAGVLTELQVDHGDPVARGAVLARLDTREQSAHVGRAKASVEQAEASLTRAKAGVAKAEASYVNAKSISDRRQSLLKTHNVSIEAAEAASAALDIADAELNLARSEVEVARATVKDAQAQAQLDSVTLDLHTLAAPYDAIVIARQKELGTVAASGEPVFTLIDPQTIWVLAYIDESKAGEIRVGQPADIVLRSLPGERLRGRVARIQIESDRVNEERRIEVAFDQIPRDIHLGEQAEVFITVTRLQQALLVPEAAIIGLGNDRGTVWTAEGGYLRQRDVTLGHRLLDGRYEITGGVPEDARVVARSAGGLREGRAATIVGGPGS